MTYTLVTSSRSQNFYPAATVPAHYGEPRTVRGITIHWWGDPATNPTFDATVAYLCRPGGNTSAHYIVEDGRVAPIVADADAAWHAGSAKGNAETIGVECNPRGSDGDYATIAALIADLRARYGDIPLYPHRYWFATTCPGTYDLGRLDQLARGAATVANPITTGGAVAGVPTLTPPASLTTDTEDDEPMNDKINALYMRYLGRPADPAGLALNGALLATGEMTYAQLAANLKQPGTESWTPEARARRIAIFGPSNPDF
jgi:hypothetical protein